MGQVWASMGTTAKKDRPNILISVAFNHARTRCLRIWGFLRQEAGVWTHNERATWGSVMSHMLLNFPKFTADLKRKPWAAFKVQKKVSSKIVLGQVWMPARRVVLGEEHGRWCAHLLHCEPNAWRRSNSTCPLLEIFLALKHKLCLHEHLPALAEGDYAHLRAVVANARCRAICTLSALYQSCLF